LILRHKSSLFLKSWTCFSSPMRAYYQNWTSGTRSSTKWFLCDTANELGAILSSSVTSHLFKLCIGLMNIQAGWVKRRMLRSSFLSVVVLWRLGDRKREHKGILCVLCCFDSRIIFEMRRLSIRNDREL
jgi:hypothetical protein